MSFGQCNMSRQDVRRGFKHAYWSALPPVFLLSAIRRACPDSYCLGTKTQLTVKNPICSLKQSLHNRPTVAEVKNKVCSYKPWKIWDSLSCSIRQLTDTLPMAFPITLSKVPKSPEWFKRIGTFWIPLPLWLHLRWLPSFLTFLNMPASLFLLWNTGDISAPGLCTCYSSCLELFPQIPVWLIC